MQDSARVVAEIDQFFGWFEEELRFVRELPTLLDAGKAPSGYTHDVLTGLCLTAICVQIDALTHVAKRKPHTCKEDFIATLLEHTCMREWGLVSLPEMWWGVTHPSEVCGRQALRQELTQLSKRPEWISPLQPRIKELVTPPILPPAQRYAAAIDRYGAGTKKRLEQAGVRVDSVLSRLLEEFRLAAIFYREYRCRLVHYAQCPVSPRSDEGKPVPKYYERHYSAPGGIFVRLEIPPSFAAAAVGNLIKNLRKACVEDGESPYQWFSIS
jgi:hypothetical protein